METKQVNLNHQSHLSRIALVVALILMVPLVAMQFTEEINWGLFDFVIMGALLFGTGLMLDLVARKVKRTSSRLILSAVVILALLAIWAELAVGAIEQAITAF